MNYFITYHVISIFNKYKIYFETHTEPYKVLSSKTLQEPPSKTYSLKFHDI